MGWCFSLFNLQVSIFKPRIRPPVCLGAHSLCKHAEHDNFVRYLYIWQVKKSFGLFLKEEKVVWEQWVIPVLVNTSPRPTEDDETSGEREGRAKRDSKRLFFVLCIFTSETRRTFFFSFGGWGRSLPSTSFALAIRIDKRSQKHGRGTPTTLFGV